MPPAPVEPGITRRPRPVTMAMPSHAPHSAVAPAKCATALWGTWLGMAILTGRGRRMMPGATGPGGMVP